MSKVIFRNSRGGGGTKIRLIKSEKNSGGHVGVPRNKGLKLALGNYVYFVDSDDALTKNNLEVFYNVAEKFNADVVHCDKCFLASDKNFSTDANKLQAVVKMPEASITQITPMSNDLSERIDNFVTGKMRWEPWVNFIRRDFLIENELTFPNLSIADDLAFFLRIFISAKNFISIPDAIYVWRERADSNCRAALPVPKNVHKNVGDCFQGITLFDKFSGKFEFFTQNPQYKYKIFDFLANLSLGPFGPILPLYAQFPAWQLDELIRQELNEIEDNVALTAFLFARMNIFNINILQQNQVIQQQQKQIQELQAQLKALS